jgi:MerR family transcriptional regulator, copper efflux regulator
MFRLLMTERMRIGELAIRTGVTARTVRYYEAIGLLPPGEREGGGQHYYDEAAVIRLRKIDQLKALGLSLEEIASVIELYFADPSGKKAKLRVLTMLRQHLQQAEQKAAALDAFCAELRGHIQRFETWLKQNG